MPKSTGFPVALPAAGAAAVPGAAAGAAGYLGVGLDLGGPLLLVLLYGGAIVGAAFLLAWAAEAAQVDISAGLALAVLALLAVLPEYAVDFVFSLRAGLLVGGGGECGEGEGANPCALALANMTGANRILVGVGWPLVVLVAAVAASRATRSERTASVPEPGAVRLAPPMKVELAFPPSRRSTRSRCR